ncbi:hypothetical protein ACFV4F_14370 [Kitasatospora sp. NPDC059722]|uniref:hypothetical protein n=1 Tax=Kitasatospora sp. NPDC059722 TaxID=3346925 RepID=UPI003673C6D7
MRTDLEDLVRLAGWTPLQGPPRVGWDAAQRAAGIELPSDYREFVDVFGSGEFRGDLGVLDPLPGPGGPAGDDGVRRMLRRTTEDVGPRFRAMREDSFDLCPYPVYPEPGGLLLWGGNYNGDHCFWLTADDDPDRWPVVLWDRGRFPDAWSRYDMGMAEFLLLVLAGETPGLADLAYRKPGVPVWVPDTGRTGAGR